ncbi:MAG TPA: hypothetical protein DCG60_01830 [Tissierella sp.]|nr:hypothetical protein [Tissierella praeacuta]HAE91378.1 hypothetical protein [Tissierella sp.]
MLKRKPIVLIIIGVCFILFYNYYNVYRTNSRIYEYIKQTIKLDITELKSLIDNNNMLLLQDIDNKELSSEDLERLIFNHEEINVLLTEIIEKIEIIKSEKYGNNIRQGKQRAIWKDTRDIYREIKKEFSLDTDFIKLDENSVKDLRIIQEYYKQSNNILDNIITNFDKDIDMWSKEISILYQ